MTQVIALAAEARERAGKGTARQTRRDGRIPAVIYGNKQAPLTISLDLRGFTRILHQPGFFTHLFDVTVDGATHRVLPRDVQFHPVSDVPLHVDFLRVSGDTRITVMVPVEFANQDKSAGLKKGGVLNIVRHEIEVTAVADN
uniref:50S ribosomal protein L25/general stress protein Ctc n=1 Tax=Azospirillum sp. TaxID=34012 RepID=UPI003D747CD6